MKRLATTLTNFCLMLALSTNSFNAQAQDSTSINDPAHPRKIDLNKLPPSAKLGASPEAKAAWERLTTEQREAAQAKVRPFIEAEIEKAKKNRTSKVARKQWRELIKGKSSASDVGSVSDVLFAFTDKHDRRKLVGGKEAEVDTSTSVGLASTKPSSNVAQAPPQSSKGLLGYAQAQAFFSKASFAKSSPVAIMQGGDADADGLPEDFEQQVSDAFTPYYHVSAGDPNQFATFFNYTPQTPKQGFGTTPVSHFRVQPLGHDYNAFGQLVSVLRIDYLTLWDYDSGPDLGFGCQAAITTTAGFAGNAFVQVIDALSQHAIDNERSAALVAAPVSDTSYYNLDPNAYSLYSVYLAAHEGTPSDRSRYGFFGNNPVPANNHINLYLARSKHATYNFNPSGLTLTPDYIIYGTYGCINAAYYYGQINYWTYISLLAAADSAFFACIIERFSEQGATAANLRINIGELNNPINESGFIYDDRLYGKLFYPVF